MSGGPSPAPAAGSASTDSDASAPGSRVRITAAVAAGIVAALLYAGQFVISRLSLQSTLSPWDLAVLRFAVAGPLMVPVLVRHGWADAAGIGWGRATALAIAAGAPFTLLVYAGLVFAPAGHGAVMVPGASPVVSTLLVWLWFGARPSAAALAGLVSIVAGVALVGAPALRAGGDGKVWLGDLLFAGAAVLWGLVPVLTRRWRIDPTRGTAVVWVLALAYLPVYGLVFGARALLAAPRGEVLLQALYQGVGVAVVALGLYAWAIRVLGSSIGSLFMPLVPVLGVLLAVPVLGEIPAAAQIAGMLAVCVGMVLVVTATSSRA